MDGPSTEPVRYTVTCLRVARPPTASGSLDLISKVGLAETAGARPYSFSANSRSNSGRRTLCHVSTLLTRWPESVTSGSGSWYFGTRASS